MRSELRKYHNENTPSGSVPSYLKEIEKNVKNITEGNDKKNQPSKLNARDSRSEHIDRKEYHELEDTKCKYCGDRLIRGEVP